MKDYLKRIYYKFKYPNTRILSRYVHKSVTLGEHVVISSNVVVGKNVKIDEYSYINQNSMIFSGEIGKFCSVSYNCLIGGANHPIKMLSTSPRIYGKNNIINNLSWDEDYKNPPKIGSDVWIGANSIIFQGVKVGNGAVVGAGSIVLNDVPDYAIVVGSPAKIIKYRFTDEIIKELLKINWWNEDIELISIINNIMLLKEESLILDKLKEIHSIKGSDL